MNKKSIKIIICLFIILGIFAISKNVCEAEDDTSVYKTITINKGEKKKITIEEIATDIRKQDSTYENYKYKDIHKNETTISDSEKVAIAVSEKEYVEIQGKEECKEAYLSIEMGFYKYIDTVINLGFGDIKVPNAIKLWNEPSIKYKIVVEDPEKKKQELEEQQEKVENAWQEIPAAGASADEIRDFIRSATAHKEENPKEDKFSEVDLETLQSWQKTIESLGMDQIQNYNDEYWKICKQIR